MASQGADPAAPQSQVVSVQAPNQTARIGTYTDTSLTQRNVEGTVAPSDLPEPKTIGNSQGDIRPVYANDQNSNIENVAAATENADVEPPPHAPNKWARGTVNGRRVSRDPYANNGMIGQDAFKNQGSGG